MPLKTRIENAIDAALLRARRGSAPTQLSSALFYAMKPGGARIRPTISLSVALACGDDAPDVSNAAATSIELIHCASLVHDDMPCFDDADIRRGKPTVHREYGEALALLTGDSLIIQGFDTLAQVARQHPALAGELMSELANFTGMPNGICAGQGWESEEHIDLSAYHRAKTGALFTAATRIGSISAGQEAEPWTELGARIGEAFQVADDLLDALYDADTIGKPAGQDALHNRPNAVSEYGVGGAVKRLEDILGGAISSIPSCPGEAMLAEMVRKTAERLTPVMPASTAAE